MEGSELTDFWYLISYRDAITPELQRVVLAAAVFYPCSSATMPRHLCRMA